MGGLRGLGTIAFNNEPTFWDNARKAEHQSDVVLLGRTAMQSSRLTRQQMLQREDARRVAIHAQQLAQRDVNYGNVPMAATTIPVATSTLKLGAVVATIAGLSFGALLL